jgi:dCTP deaminase
MVLSNSEILKAINEGGIVIEPFPRIPTMHNPDSPLNTSALDLRLGNTISLPKRDRPFAFDLRKGGIANFLKDNFETRNIDPDGGFTLEPHRFVLANTLEKITLNINPTGVNFAARVEGRSSFARCGLLIHFTAPTIHAGFTGTITLELMNLGNNPITLFPEIYICQLIFEKVEGEIYYSPSQFQGQRTPEGTS